MSTAAVANSKKSSSTAKRKTAKSSRRNTGADVAMAICSLAEADWRKVTESLKNSSNRRTSMEDSAAHFIQDQATKQVDAVFTGGSSSTLHRSPPLEEINQWYVKNTGSRFIEPQSSAASIGSRSHGFVSTLSIRSPETKARYSLRTSVSDPNIGDASYSRRRRFTPEYYRLLRDLTDACKHIIRREEMPSTDCLAETGTEDVELLYNCQVETWPTSKLRFAMSVVHAYEHCSFESYPDLHDVVVLRRHLWRVQQRDRELCETGPVLFTKKAHSPPVERLLLLSSSSSETSPREQHRCGFFSQQQDLPPGILVDRRGEEPLRSSCVQDEISERNNLKHWQSSKYSPVAARHRSEQPPAAAAAASSQHNEDDDASSSTTGSSSSATSSSGEEECNSASVFKLSTRKRGSNGRYYRRRRRGLSRKSTATAAAAQDKD